MKKISTLAFMAFFCCVSAMAQVVLGDIKFSAKDGAKLNPTTGKITVTFPDVTGVEDPAATSFVLEGNFGSEENPFDGVEGTFASGVTFDLVEYDLQPGTDYTLTITSVKVGDDELAAEGGYKLNFKTRGAERKMSWTFAIDEESVAKIKADENAEGNETAGVGQFWSVVTADQRHYVHQKLTGSEIMLDANTPLPMTEDLYFNINADKIYVGDVKDTKYKNNLVFNANAQQIIIPDCQEGDVITFNNCKYATKPTSSKFPVIVAMNGAAIAPDGLVSSSGLQDSIDVPKNAANLKFEVLVPGDVTFTIGQCNLTGISIEAGVEKKPCKYNIVAAYTEGETVTTLKELVGETAGVTGSTVKIKYPYWLADAEGKVYTYGSKGSPFEIAFDLKGDTTFVINYSKTAFADCVFLSEGEDLAGAELCTSGNAEIRSSMAKAAFFAEDLKLVTLQPGSYKIRAVLFDANKTANFQCTLTKGEGEENQIVLTATATNFDEQESDLIEITEATDITLKACGNANQGVDVIMIYASTDAPEDPDGINEVKDAQKVVARKVAKDGRILIQTAAGTFNAVGVQVK